MSAEIQELQERRALLNQPWLEEFTHWSYDGEQWQLHGHYPPVQGRHPRCVTSTGWCPGLIRDQRC